MRAHFRWGLAAFAAGLVLSATVLGTGVLSERQEDDVVWRAVNRGPSPLAGQMRVVVAGVAIEFHNFSALPGATEVPIKVRPRGAFTVEADFWALGATDAVGTLSESTRLSACPGKRLAVIMEVEGRGGTVSVYTAYPRCEAL